MSLSKIFKKSEKIYKFGKLVQGRWCKSKITLVQYVTKVRKSGILKKSLAQEVCQKSDISECRSKG